MKRRLDARFRSPFIWLGFRRNPNEMRIPFSHAAGRNSVMDCMASISGIHNAIMKIGNEHPAEHCSESQRPRPAHLSLYFCWPIRRLRDATLNIDFDLSHCAHSNRFHSTLGRRAADYALVCVLARIHTGPAEQRRSGERRGRLFVHVRELGAESGRACESRRVTHSQCTYARDAFREFRINWNVISMIIFQQQRENAVSPAFLSLSVRPAAVSQPSVFSLLKTTSISLRSSFH